MERTVLVAAWCETGLGIMFYLCELGLDPKTALARASPPRSAKCIQLSGEQAARRARVTTHSILSALSTRLPDCLEFLRNLKPLNPFHSNLALCCHHLRPLLVLPFNDSTWSRSQALDSGASQALSLCLQTISSLATEPSSIPHTCVSP